MFRLGRTAAAASFAITAVAAGSLADIDHVVLFMQENRAFDHYFGTMAGIRGFSDPNVQITNGKPVFYQNVNSSLTNATDYLLPFYLNYLGGNWPEATQCMGAGSNGWGPNQGALNHDQNNMWALSNTPWSWGYFKRQDLEVQFGIAEGWTVGDMYQQSVISSTNPNRVQWISGSINVPGSPQSPDQGGVVLDNNETPGCEGPHLNCYPAKWETVPEVYQQAGVSWQVYQDINNFDDNPLAWFQQFENASNTSALYQRGMTYLGLERFYADAAAGTLPQVSYLIGPAELSEHPPYQPKDGAWLQQQVVNAVVHSPAYNRTALIITYDETGGFGDHVTPYHSPPGTPGEWMEDPYGEYGYVYTGPGFRLPFYIVSPWTRGGHVYTEYSSHDSQILFVEKWLASKGINATTNQMDAWRRSHMADLTGAFDFDHPDYSIPHIPTATAPSINKTSGAYNGYATCAAAYPTPRPPVPYGQQHPSSSLVSEQGFKQVRGQLTEGRFLVFEMNGYALSQTWTDRHGRGGGGAGLSATKATATHSDRSQRWVIHQLQPGGNQFAIGSASAPGSFCRGPGDLAQGREQAETFTINDLGSGRGYTLRGANGQYLGIGANGQVRYGGAPAGFHVFSVTYDD